MIRIKRINCEQFAGISGRSEAFKEGINVIEGNNESGKSSLIDFLFTSLFVPTGNVKALDRRCFPKKADGRELPITGSVEISTDSGDYLLTKTWSKNKKSSSASLKLPTGSIVDSEDEINRILENILIYGEGTFRETIFSSQRNDNLAVEYLLGEYKENSDTGKAADAVLDVFASAALTTGNIEIDSIGAGIRNNIDEYCKRWDMASGKPTSDGRTKPGEISKAYNNLEKLKDEQAKLIDSETNVDRILHDINDRESKACELSGKLEDYGKFKAAIERKHNLEDKLDALEKTQRESKAALHNWPEAEEGLHTAEKYKKELDNADVYDQYRKAEPLRRHKEELEEQLRNTPEVDENDISTLQNLKKEKDEELKKLNNLNIEARISRISKTDVKLSYEDDGSAIEVSDNSELSLKRAIRIEVGDSLDMFIEPSGIDASDIKKTLNDIDAGHDRICGKYGVNTLEEIKGLREQRRELDEKYRSACKDLNAALNGKTWETLKGEKDIRPESRSRDEVLAGLGYELNIKENEISQFISDRKLTVDTYKSRYQDVGKLEESVRNGEAEISRLKDEIAGIDTPDSLDGIDPDKIKEEINALNEEVSDLRNGDLTDAKSVIVSQMSLADYNNEISEATKEYESVLATGRRWTEIMERYNSIMASVDQRDFSSLRRNFEHYLGKLSDGIEVTDMNDNLRAMMTSGDNLLTRDTLSNGTRETITLAFRLAMLDELFPEGKGFAVFDDTFVNMDPQRTKNAVALLKEYAEDRDFQIIFVTCHPETSKLLTKESETEDTVMTDR